MPEYSSGPCVVLEYLKDFSFGQDSRARYKTLIAKAVEVRIESDRV